MNAPETVDVPDGDCLECGGNRFHDRDRLVDGVMQTVREPCLACTPRLDDDGAQALAGGNQLGGFRGSGAQRDAALANYPRSGTQRAQVLKALAAHPDGATDFELSQATGILRNVVAKRRQELVDRGLAVATDQRRPTDTGTSATVWVAV